jgi:hypothetical protein
MATLLTAKIFERCRQLPNGLLHDCVGLPLMIGCLPHRSNLALQIADLSIVPYPLVQHRCLQQTNFAPRVRVDCRVRGLPIFDFPRKFREFELVAQSAEVAGVVARDRNVRTANGTDKDPQRVGRNSRLDRVRRREASGLRLEEAAVHHKWPYWDAERL